VSGRHVGDCSTRRHSKNQRHRWNRDAVWHKSLISKLPFCWFYPSVCAFISSFLHGCSITAMGDGQCCSPRLINDAASHDSVLSSTLFLFIINDFFSRIWCPFHSCANDYRTFFSVICQKTLPAGVIIMTYLETLQSTYFLIILSFLNGVGITSWSSVPRKLISFTYQLDTTFHSSLVDSTNTLLHTELLFGCLSLMILSGNYIYQLFLNQLPLSLTFYVVVTGNFSPRFWLYRMTLSVHT